MKNEQKHDYDTVYIPTLDITLIVDHRTVGESLRLVNYYYGNPEEKYTTYYISLAENMPERG